MAECIESVRAQTYENIEHIVVVDGKDRWEKAEPILRASEFPNGRNEHICVLPYPTGTNRYNGHRVYGAATYFADGDYHIWLDDDNMISPNHVESLVKLVQEKNLDWAFSFRKIIDKDNQILCNDDCESLGKWPTFQGSHHIDTNCYCIKTSIAIHIASVWHGGWGQDRVFLSAISQHFPKWDCTNEYTTCYRVDGGKGSVNAEFFINGNEVMNKKYNGVFPWRQKT